MTVGTFQTSNDAAAHNQLILDEVACPLCGSDRRRIAAGGLVNFLNRNDTQRYSFSECADCSLAYLNPRPRNLDAVYPEDYSKHQANALGTSRFRDWSRRLLHRLFLNYPPRPVLAGLGRSLFKRRWEAYRAHHPQLQVPWRGEGRGRLLDVGSGAGDKAAKFRLLGWQVIGVETDPEAAARARQIHGLDIRAGYLSQQDFKPASFDAATLMSVLEHVPAPLDLLREIHALLVPGGVLLLDVPSWNSRLREAFGPAWTQYAAPQHWLIPTEKTLRAMAEQAGFRVEWIEQRCSMSLYRKSILRAKELGTLDPALPTDNASILNWFTDAVKSGRGELQLMLASKPVV